MVDYIIIGAIVLIIGGALFYIIKAKKTERSASDAPIAHHAQNAPLAMAATESATKNQNKSKLVLSHLGISE